MTWVIEEVENDPEWTEKWSIEDLKWSKIRPKIWEITGGPIFDSTNIRSEKIFLFLLQTFHATTFLHRTDLTWPHLT